MRKFLAPLTPRARAAASALQDKNLVPTGVSSPHFVLRICPSPTGPGAIVMPLALPRLIPLPPGVGSEFLSGGGDIGENGGEWGE